MLWHCKGLCWIARPISLHRKKPQGDIYIATYKMVRLYEADYLNCKITPPVDTDGYGVWMIEQNGCMLYPVPSMRPSPASTSLHVFIWLLVVLGLTRIRLRARRVRNLSTDQRRLGGRLVLRVQEVLNVLQSFAPFLLLLLPQRLGWRGSARSRKRGSGGSDSEWVAEARSSTTMANLPRLWCTSCWQTLAHICNITPALADLLLNKYD